MGMAGRGLLGHVGLGAVLVVAGIGVLYVINDNDDPADHRKENPEKVPRRAAGVVETAYAKAKTGENEY